MDVYMIPFYLYEIEEDVGVTIVEGNVSMQIRDT